MQSQVAQTSISTAIYLLFLFSFTSQVYAEVQVKPTKCLVKTGQSLDIDCVVTTSTDWPVWLNQSSTEPRASHVCSPDGRVRQGLQYKFSVEKTDSHTYRLRIKDVQLSDEGWFYCQETAEIRNLANTTVTVTGEKSASPTAHKVGIVCVLLYVSTSLVDWW